MSLSYTYAVDDSVLEVFAQSKARDRQELLRIFKHLANAPFQRGDFVQRTATIRELQVKRLGKWLITYWPDHASSELRVVDLKKLVC